MHDRLKAALVFVEYEIYNSHEPFIPEASSTLLNDLIELTRQGYLTCNQGEYSLTSKGEKFLGEHYHA